MRSLFLAPLVLGLFLLTAISADGQTLKIPADARALLPQGSLAALVIPSCGTVKDRLVEAARLLGEAGAPLAAAAKRVTPWVQEMETDPSRPVICVLSVVRLAGKPHPLPAGTLILPHQWNRARREQLPSVLVNRSYAAMPGLIAQGPDREDVSPFLPASKALRLLDVLPRADLVLRFAVSQWFDVAGSEYEKQPPLAEGFDDLITAVEEGLDIDLDGKAAFAFWVREIVPVLPLIENVDATVSLRQGRVKLDLDLVMKKEWAGSDAKSKASGLDRLARLMPRPGRLTLVSSVEPKWFRESFVPAARRFAPLLPASERKHCLRGLELLEKLSANAGAGFGLALQEGKPGSFRIRGLQDSASLSKSSKDWRSLLDEVVKGQNWPLKLKGRSKAVGEHRGTLISWTYDRKARTMSKMRRLLQDLFGKPQPKLGIFPVKERLALHLGGDVSDLERYLSDVQGRGFATTREMHQALETLGTDARFVLAFDANWLSQLIARLDGTKATETKGDDEERQVVLALGRGARRWRLHLSADLKTLGGLISR